MIDLLKNAKKLRKNLGKIQTEIDNNLTDEQKSNLVSPGQILNAIKSCDVNKVMNVYNKSLESLEKLKKDANKH